MAYRTEKRFKRYEPDRNIGVLEMLETASFILVLDRNTNPDVSGDWHVFISTIYVTLHQGASFCEHLINMMVCFLHSIENSIDKFNRHVLLKKIAH